MTHDRGHYRAGLLVWLRKREQHRRRWSVWMRTTMEQQQGNEIQARLRDHLGMLDGLAAVW